MGGGAQNVEENYCDFFIIHRSGGGEDRITNHEGASCEKIRGDCFAEVVLASAMDIADCMKFGFCSSSGVGGCV